MQPTVELKMSEKLLKSAIDPGTLLHSQHPQENSAMESRLNSASSEGQPRVREFTTTGQTLTSELRGQEATSKLRDQPDCGTTPICTTLRSCLLFGWQLWFRFTRRFWQRIWAGLGGYWEFLRVGKLPRSRLVLYLYYWLKRNLLNGTMSLIRTLIMTVVRHMNELSELLDFENCETLGAVWDDVQHLKILYINGRKGILQLIRDATCHFSSTEKLDISVIRNNKSSSSFKKYFE